MLNIAYCDNLKEDRQLVLSALMAIEEKWKTEFNMSAFSNGEDLCESFSQNHYDVVILDILMEVLDGIETAKKIRSMGEECPFIFVSSDDRRIKELFPLGTFGFLDKPLVSSKLEPVLKRVVDEKKSNQHVFIFNKKKFTQHFPLKEIIYFESRKNQILIHTTKKTENYYGTLTDVWADLQDTNTFIMPHKSFILNLQHISVSHDKITIKHSGQTFNIGELYKKDTHKRYLNFIK